MRIISLLIVVVALSACSNAKEAGNVLSPSAAVTSTAITPPAHTRLPGHFPDYQTGWEYFRDKCLKEYADSGNYTSWDLVVGICEQGATNAMALDPGPYDGCQRQICH